MSLYESTEFMDLAAKLDDVDGWDVGGLIDDVVAKLENGEHSDAEVLAVITTLRGALESLSTTSDLSDLLGLQAIGRKLSGLE